MKSDQLVRISGLGAIWGGIFIIFARVMQVLLFGDTPLSEHAASPYFWVALGLPGLLGSILFTVGAIGLYARQAGQLGVAGLSVFGLVFFGLMLSTGANWAYAFVAPYLAAVSPSLLDLSFNDPAWGIMGKGFLVSYVVGAASWLLMGGMTFFGKVIPRRVGAIMVISMLLAAFLPLGTSGMAGIIVNFFLGLGPLVFGYYLWTEKREES